MRSGRSDCFPKTDPNRKDVVTAMSFSMLCWMSFQQEKTRIDTTQVCIFVAHILTNFAPPQQCLTHITVSVNR